MNKLLSLIVILGAACGNSSSENELVGQVKYVKNITPIVCEDYGLVDISMGTVRNGVGSMSTHDMTLVVSDKSLEATLKHAAEVGDIVKVTYDVHRVAFCWPDHRVTGVSEIGNGSGSGSGN